MKRRLYCVCYVNCRSERVEYSICDSVSRSSFSNETLGRSPLTSPAREVHVFANTTAVADILPAFLKANSTVIAELREMANTDVALGASEGRADLSIVSRRMDSFGLRAVCFDTDRLGLVVIKGHRFARSNAVAFSGTLEKHHVSMHAARTLHGYLLELTQAMGRPLCMRVQISIFDALCPYARG